MGLHGRLDDIAAFRGWSGFGICFLSSVWFGGSWWWCGRCRRRSSEGGDLGFAEANIHFQAGDLTFEGSGTRFRDAGLPGEELLQAFGGAEFADASIGGLGAVKVEVFELCQCAEFGDACVGDLGVFEVQALQVRELREGGSTGIGDLTAGEINPDDMGGDGLNQGEFFVTELVGGIDDAEAELLGVLSERHEAGVESLHLRRDFGDLLLLSIGQRSSFGLLDLGDGGAGLRQTFGEEGSECTFDFGCGLGGSDGVFLGGTAVDPPFQ